MDAHFNTSRFIRQIKSEYGKILATMRARALMDRMLRNHNAYVQQMFERCSAQFFCPVAQSAVYTELVSCELICSSNAKGMAS